MSPQRRERLRAQNRTLHHLVDLLLDLTGRLADRGRDLEEELRREVDA